MPATMRRPEGFKPPRSAVDRCSNENSGRYNGTGNVLPPKHPDDLPKKYVFTDDFEPRDKNGHPVQKEAWAKKGEVRELTREWIEYWGMGLQAPPIKLVK